MKKLLFLITLSVIFSCNPEQTRQTASFTSLVNPFIGTGGHGHTFPGATTPFGMVQLSPDTRIDGSWDGCGGYHYSDSLIYGFSHTHLSGTGVSDYGDLLIMPTLKNTFNNEEYSATFTHNNEKASPGFYEVKLDNQINVSLTSTTRCGFHKYVFPNNEGTIVIDLQHRDELLNGVITMVDDQSLAITRISKAWAQQQHFYGFIECSTPFEISFNQDSTIANLNFSKKEVLLKTGCSFVSEEGAKENLEKELTHWDFEQVKNDANNLWNKELSKIELEDTDENKKSIFYTALYHTMIHPNIAMDVNRNYRGMDNQIHVAENFDYYTVFSLWDTFRTAHPLYTLIDKKRTNDFIQTFLVQYKQGGRLPVWELASNETDCMIGYHSVSVIADALAKGIDDFDKKLAYDAMKKSANWNHLGVPDYIKNQHLSIDDEHESVSKTLEYAYDDWCIAQVAKHLNKEEDYQTYMARSQSWKNLLDPQTKLMRPRKNGGWLTPYDPKEVNNYFTEANAWQYSFFVPHDVYTLIEKMGGPIAFEAKLDQLFNEVSETSGRHQVDITGLIGQYAHGNEPSHHMAYLYNYIGKPEKAQEKLNQIYTEFYTTKPNGLIGNEDCGQMSAWYVMSSLGFYQINPGQDDFVYGKPNFQKATINLENGNKFIVNATNLKSDKIYVSDIKLNNEDAIGDISYQSIMNGGTLDFEMSANAQPKMNQCLPKKEETTEAIIEVPSIFADKRYFTETLQVSIEGNLDQKTLYTIDGTEPTVTSMVYSESFIISENTTVKARALNQVGQMSPIVTAHFYKKPNNWEISINTQYDPSYSAGGDEAVIDGIKGDEDWRKGDWQGYQNANFEAIIDLKDVRQISEISTNFLQDTRAWILMPKSVSYFTSMDGQNFEPFAIAENSISPDDYNVQLQTLTGMTNAKNAKFIKIIADNFGQLPEWHLGNGGEAYIFVDEVSIR